MVSGQLALLNLAFSQVYYLPQRDRKVRNGTLLMKIDSPWPCKVIHILYIISILFLLATSTVGVKYVSYFTCKTRNKVQRIKEIIKKIMTAARGSPGDAEDWHQVNQDELMLCTYSIDNMSWCFVGIQTETTYPLSSIRESHTRHCFTPGLPTSRSSGSRIKRVYPKGAIAHNRFQRFLSVPLRREYNGHSNPSLQVTNSLHTITQAVQ